VKGEGRGGGRGGGAFFRGFQGNTIKKPGETKPVAEAPRTHADAGFGDSGGIVSDALTMGLA
jgi:hypothetical protein